MGHAYNKKIIWLSALITIGASGHLFAHDFTSNIHGEVVAQDRHNVRGAIAEKVVIYPRESEKSYRKIARNGLLLRYPKAKATILICHGFMCNQCDVGFLRSLFDSYNIMTFDFRAHGENVEGQYCTFGRDEACDVQAAAGFLRNHPDLKDKPLYVYGFSMGAVSSIEAQAKDNTLFDAMVLDCPFDSSENVIKHGLSNMKFTLFGREFEMPGKSVLQKYAFHPYVQSALKVTLKAVAQMDATNVQTHICPISPAESVKKVNIPCFFIHCKNDEKVSVSAIKSVYQGAAGYKLLWLTNGRRHYDSYFFNPELYRDNVQNFLNLVLNGKIMQEKVRDRVVEDSEDHPFNWALKNEKKVNNQ